MVIMYQTNQEELIRMLDAQACKAQELGCFVDGNQPCATCCQFAYCWGEKQA